jgi:hypothetical protein
MAFRVLKHTFRFLRIKPVNPRSTCEIRTNPALTLPIRHDYHHRHL